MTAISYHSIFRMSAPLALFLWLVCAPFTAIAAPAPDNSPADASGHSVICHHGSVGYVVSPPPGWVNDFATGERLGTCTVYIPEGTTFDDAPAVIYPRAVKRPGGGTLEETARMQAEATLGQLSGARTGAGPRLVKGPLVPTNVGDAFALWLFNEGPRPTSGRPPPTCRKTTSCSSWCCPRGARRTGTTISRNLKRSRGTCSPSTSKSNNGPSAARHPGNAPGPPQSLHPGRAAPV